MLQFDKTDFAGIEVFLCDADGNLFPSEEPTFVASTDVTNQFMRELGVDTAFTPDELRLATTGKNFRTTAVDLALGHGIALDPTLAARYPDLATANEAVSHGGRILTADVLDR